MSPPQAIPSRRAGRREATARELTVEATKKTRKAVSIPLIENATVFGSTASMPIRTRVAGRLSSRARATRNRSTPVAPRTRLEIAR